MTTIATQRKTSHQPCSGRCFKFNQTNKPEAIAGFNLVVVELNAGGDIEKITFADSDLLENEAKLRGLAGDTTNNKFLATIGCFGICELTYDDITVVRSGDF